MIKAIPPHLPEIDLQEQRHIKAFYSRLVDSLHEIATPDEISFSPDQASATLAIINSSVNRINKVLPFRAHAVLLLNDAMEFTPYCWHPPELRQQFDSRMQQWIEDGHISWTINQNRAVVIHGNGQHETTVLHAIAVRNRVKGLFIGYINASTELDEALLAMISVVLLNCSNTLDSCELHYKLRQQNELLEQQVRQRTRQLELAKQRAEESTRSKSLFLATMSHELRTPMNGVIGMAQLLGNTHLDERQRHYTHTILQSGRALTALINDILDFSRIEAGRLAFDNHPFDLEQVALNVIELLSFQIEKRPVELCFVQESETPLHVVGDSARLRQILINLLSNAIKFTERGTITLTIAAEVVKERVIKLHISVSDSGIGIAPEVLPTLFTPFIQAENSTWRTHGGTGLGLAICKQLVEQMNGAIGVNSQPGQGSTFWFDIELPQAQLDEAQAPSPSLAAPHEINTLSSHETSRKKPRILVAEDNPVNQEVISHMLEALGCQVKMAENGQEAIYFLARSSFDLILMDYRMPLLDGCETALYIRSTAGRNQRIPIITLSASTQPEELQRYREAGMDDFLAKPVEQAALARMLDKWLHMETEELTTHANPPTQHDKPVAQLLDEATINNLLQLMGDGFAPLKQTFIDNCQRKLLELHQAIAATDMEQIKLLAHSLKGSCGTVGAIAMATQAKRIEEEIKAGNYKATNTLSMELEQLFDATVAKLEALPSQE